MTLLTADSRTLDYYLLYYSITLHHSTSFFSSCCCCKLWYSKNIFISYIYNILYLHIQQKHKVIFISWLPFFSWPREHHKIRPLYGYTTIACWKELHRSGKGTHWPPQIPCQNISTFSSWLFSLPLKMYLIFKKSITTYRRCRERKRIRGKDTFLCLSLHSR